SLIIFDSEGNSLKSKIHHGNAEKFSASFHHLLYGECTRPKMPPWMDKFWTPMLQVHLSAG
ncbi:hypothetical protein, partial [Enterobacter hormaechei]|uniref:hypothetical protein n=1 Tax=Enterobacter hormaechei TaxID=158836 RepID=UPI00210D7EB3